MYRPPWKIKREILVKSEAESVPLFGSDPWKRPIEEYIHYGIVNLDKPAGPTSHQVAAMVRDILHLSRVGHGGTLGAGEIPP